MNFYEEFTELSGRFICDGLDVKDADKKAITRMIIKHRVSEQELLKKVYRDKKVV